MIDDPDTELVQAIARGDRHAAEALVRRRMPAMIALARRMLADPIEAEDVAQEVFLKVWRHAASWEPGTARFETWMRRVATNLCLDRLRRRREVATEDAGADLPDPARSASSGMLERERSASVRAAVAALPERQRIALELCHFQELGNIEAAKIMEVSIEALESLLSRGRRALRAALLSRRSDLLGPAEAFE